MNKNKKMNLQRFAEGNYIGSKDASALIPEQVSEQIMQSAIQNSVVLQLGRKLQNMTSNRTSMPVLDMLPVAYFVSGEPGVKKTTKQAWDKKVIYAEEIAVIVPIPEAVIDDSNYDLWGEVKPRLAEAFGAKIDGAVLFGADKPASWRDDIVKTATAAGAKTTLTSDLYADIMSENGVIANIETSGFLPTGAIADVSMRAKLRGLRDQQGNPLFKSDMQGSTNYALDGNPMYFPLNGAYDPTKALMICGDFSQLVYSIRQDITFKIFTEGVIQDPTTGEIVYNLMQNDMVALRAVMRLGWELPNPVNRMKADKIKRCPFSLLLPAE